MERLMNTKNNQRTRVTKQLLRDAFLRLMADRPASKITVTDICRLAEINRSTFYLHYSEPNDLLIELEDDTIRLMASSLSSIGALHGAVSGIEGYLAGFLRYIRENDRLFRALLVDNSDPHFRRKLRSAAMELAETAFDVDIPPEIRSNVYRYIVSGCIELLAEWIQSGYELPTKAMCDLLIRLSEGSLKRTVL